MSAGEAVEKTFDTKVRFASTAKMGLAMLIAIVKGAKYEQRIGELRLRSSNMGISN